MAGSGCTVEYAVTRRGTSTRRSGGAGLPASGSTRALKLPRSCGGERRALVRDALHELFPRLDEGLGAFQLKLFRERVHVDAGRGKAREDLLRVPAVRGQGRGR